MNEAKAWKCESGHVLGQVIRNGSGIRVLLIYRQAVDEEAMAATQVDVLAAVEGYCANVRCSICGSCRTWVPGQEALREMLKRMGYELAGDVSR